MDESNYNFNIQQKKEKYMSNLEEGEICKIPKSRILNPKIYSNDNKIGDDQLEVKNDLQKTDSPKKFDLENNNLIDEKYKKILIEIEKKEIEKNSNLNLDDLEKDGNKINILKENDDKNIEILNKKNIENVMNIVEIKFNEKDDPENHTCNYDKSYSKEAYSKEDKNENNLEESNNNDTKNSGLFTIPMDIEIDNVVCNNTFKRQNNEKKIKEENYNDENSILEKSLIDENKLDNTNIENKSDNQKNLTINNNNIILIMNRNENIIKENLNKCDVDNNSSQEDIKFVNQDPNFIKEINEKNMLAQEKVNKEEKVLNQILTVDQIIENKEILNTKNFVINEFHEDNSAETNKNYIKIKILDDNANIIKDDTDTKANKERNDNSKSLKNNENSNYHHFKSSESNFSKNNNYNNDHNNIIKKDQTNVIEKLNDEKSHKLYNNTNSDNIKICTDNLPNEISNNQSDNLNANSEKKIPKENHESDKDIISNLINNKNHILNKTNSINKNHINESYNINNSKNEIDNNYLNNINKNILKNNTPKLEKKMSNVDESSSENMEEREMKSINNDKSETKNEISQNPADNKISNLVNMYNLNFKEKDKNKDKDKERDKDKDKDKDKKLKKERKSGTKNCIYCKIEITDPSLILKFKSSDDFLTYCKLFFEKLPQQKKEIYAKSITSFEKYYTEKYSNFEQINNIIFKSIKSICKFCYEENIKEENGFINILAALNYNIIINNNKKDHVINARKEMLNSSLNMVLNENNCSNNNNNNVHNFENDLPNNLNMKNMNFNFGEILANKKNFKHFDHINSIVNKESNFNNLNKSFDDGKDNKILNNKNFTKIIKEEEISEENFSLTDKPSLNNNNYINLNNQVIKNKFMENDENKNYLIKNSISSDLDSSNQMANIANNKSINTIKDIDISNKQILGKKIIRPDSEVNPTKNKKKSKLSNDNNKLRNLNSDLESSITPNNSLEQKTKNIYSDVNSNPNNNQNLNTINDNKKNDTNITTQFLNSNQTNNLNETNNLNSANKNNLNSNLNMNTKNISLENLNITNVYMNFEKEKGIKPILIDSKISDNNELAVNTNQNRSITNTDKQEEILDLGNSNIENNSIFIENLDDLKKNYLNLNNFSLEKKLFLNTLHKKSEALIQNISDLEKNNMYLNNICGNGQDNNNNPELENEKRNFAMNNTKQMGILMNSINDQFEQNKNINYNTKINLNPNHNISQLNQVLDRYQIDEKNNLISNQSSLNKKEYTNPNNNNIVNINEKSNKMNLINNNNFSNTLNNVNLNNYQYVLKDDNSYLKINECSNNNENKNLILSKSPDEKNLLFTKDHNKANLIDRILYPNNNSKNSNTNYNNHNMNLKENKNISENHNYNLIQANNNLIQEDQNLMDPFILNKNLLYSNNKIISEINQELDNEINNITNLEDNIHSGKLKIGSLKAIQNPILMNQNINANLNGALGIPFNLNNNSNNLALQQMLINQNSSIQKLNNISNLTNSNIHLLNNTNHLLENKNQSNFNNTSNINDGNSLGNLNMQNNNALINPLQQTLIQSQLGLGGIPIIIPGLQNIGSLQTNQLSNINALLQLNAQNPFSSLGHSPATNLLQNNYLNQNQVDLNLLGMSINNSLINVPLPLSYQVPLQLNSTMGYPFTSVIQIPHSQLGSINQIPITNVNLNQLDLVGKMNNNIGINNYQNSTAALASNANLNTMQQINMLKANNNIANNNLNNQNSICDGVSLLQQQNLFKNINNNNIDENNLRIQELGKFEISNIIGQQDSYMPIKLENKLQNQMGMEYNLQNQDQNRNLLNKNQQNNHQMMMQNNQNILYSQALLNQFNNQNMSIQNLKKLTEEEES